MPSPYRFAGETLEQAGGIWNVQKKNNGMLELAIDFLVPGGKEVLILSLEEFKIPGRKVGSGDMPYINGVSHYPTNVSPQDPISATFRDFPQTKARDVLNKWFKATYDEETGLMLPSGLLKASGYVVLFLSDGTNERAARLEGVWLTNQPDIDVSYQGGEHMTMSVDIAVDRVIWESSLANPSAA